MEDKDTKRTQLSSLVSDWFKSQEGITQLNEAQSNSEKLLNHLHDESLADPDSLKKPFNL